MTPAFRHTKNIMHSRIFTKTAAAAAASLFAALCAAQSADTVTTLDAVSVTASALKIDTSAQETPQTVNIITSETLSDQVATKIDDALRYTPGFWNQYGQDYDTNWMYIRGFEVSTLVDGHMQYQEGFFESTIEPFGLEKIEVLQGPSSALYGNSKPGGVVNMVTKKPTKDPLHQVSVSGGSNNFYMAGLDISDHITDDGSQRFRIVAAANKTDSVLDGVDGWRAYLSPSYTIDFTPQTSLTLIATYTKDRRVNNSAFFSTYGTFYPVNGQYVSRHTNYGDPDHDRFDKDQTTVGWEFSHAFNDVWTYKNTFSFKHDDFFLRNTAAYNWTPLTMKRWTIVNDGTSDSFTFDNNLTGEFETGDFANILQVGFDYAHYENDFRNNGASGAMVGDEFSVLHPPYGGLPGNNELTLWDTDITKKQLGIYAQAQTTWAEKLTAKVGVRYDRVKASVDTGDASALSPHQSRDTNQTSWNAGLMYTSEIGVAPYVNYAESFYMPGSLAFASDGDKTNKYVMSKPVESDQWEIGVKFTPEWLDGFMNIAWFDLTQKNAPTQQTFGSVPLTVQSPEKETKGIEVELHASIAKYVGVDLAYTYMDATYGDNGARADYMPNHSATAWVSYDFAGVGLTGLKAGTGVRYLGTTVNTATKAKLDSALLWDAHASYMFDKHWKVNGSITNITDHVYLAGAYGNIAFYGEGRTARVTLSYSW